MLKMKLAKKLAAANVFLTDKEKSIIISEIFKDFHSGHRKLKISYVYS